MNHNLASTSVVKALWLCGSLSGPLSGGAQIVRRGLSRPSIGNNLERDLLPFIEAVHPGAFDRADVHEDVIAAFIRLNESETLLAVKPLDCSRHGSLPS
jgi:hypothetical protein